MKKVAIILADGFEEIEAISIIDILRRSGIKVEILGYNETTLTGAHDITILADDKFDYYTDLDYDGIIFAGGMKNAQILGQDEDVMEFIRHYNSDKKLVAGICASPSLVLYNAGILDGKDVTCYPDMELISRMKNSNYIDKYVVVCDNIITSQSPYSAMAFALSLVNYFDMDANLLQSQLKGN